MSRGWRASAPAGLYQELRDAIRRHLPLQPDAGTCDSGAQIGGRDCHQPRGDAGGLREKPRRRAPLSCRKTPAVAAAHDAAAARPTHRLCQDGWQAGPQRRRRGGPAAGVGTGVEQRPTASAISAPQTSVARFDTETSKTHSRNTPALARPAKTLRSRCVTRTVMSIGPAASEITKNRRETHNQGRIRGACPQRRSIYSRVGLNVRARETR